MSSWTDHEREPRDDRMLTLLLVVFALLAIAVAVSG